ncbi:MAG: DUF6455 family protein [Paracoccaceae bacterium]
MIGYVGAPRAWGLTRGMARVLGVDLTDAVVEGWLSRPELGAMVDRCGACPHEARCLDWLSRHVSAPALPGYCRNRQALEALRSPT